jgi:hypothetical protein
MVWFKVDDKFHSSKEVLLIPSENRHEAIGLWTLTGAWSADHLTDGFIADYVLEAMGGRREIANLLVRPAKLWARKRDGFQFRNWERWQITRAEVEKTRQAERDRKAAYRQRRQESIEDVPGGVPVGQIHRPDTPTRPDPTRPDPINKTGLKGGVGTTGPFCARHPGGTEEACGACRTARLAFEDARKAEKTKPTPTPRAAKPGDGHRHKYDGDYCIHCQTRRP